MVTIISWRTSELQQTASKGWITGATMTSATERNGRVAQRWLVQQSGIAGMTEWDGWCSGMGAMVQRIERNRMGWLVQQRDGQPVQRNQMDVATT